MIAEPHAAVRAALEPLGLPVRSYGDGAAVTGPCYYLRPATVTVTITAGRCLASRGQVEVLVVAPNALDTERLAADTDAAIAALGEAGHLSGDVEVAPAQWETPDLANPLPAYSIPCTA